ncbi:MAG: hypothetical protein ACUVUQ_06060 [Thermodesulfovibrionales bacterium]
MMKYSVVAVLTISFLAILLTLLNAKEPQMPDMNKSLEPEKEAKITEVMSLPAKEAFKQLKSIDFIVEEDLLNKAIFKTFRHRKTEGINLALKFLELPLLEMHEGKLIADRTADFYVAKKILEVFPSESVGKLLMLYKEGDAITKGNIIRASGQIAGGKRIKNLLIKALDDKTFCEEENPEMDGPPMRICDVAYNQLILRYSIEDLQRAIGNIDTLENRDYYINLLKKRLKAEN